MLERNIVSGEETSKYFHHNNKLAKEWEKLAGVMNGKINGTVNGQLLEFNFHFSIKSTRIHIYQIRQLSNKHTGNPFEKGILMTKNTKIEFTPFKAGSDNWKIVKNTGWLQFLYNITRYTIPLGYNPRFLLVSDKKLVLQKVLSKQQFELIAKTAVRHVIKKGSLLKIEFYNALGADSAMKIINSMVEP